jgi:hypothetical protein
MQGALWRRLLAHVAIEEKIAVRQNVRSPIQPPDSFRGANQKFLERPASPDWRDDAQARSLIWLS